MGQTTQHLSTRWKQHIQESKEFSERPLYRALRKYGVGMFNVRILEEDIPVEKLSERECWWIEQFDSYNSGYNATTGGERGSTIREDVREKISSSMLGIAKSDEQVAKMRSTLKSINHTFSVRGDGKHLRMKIKAIELGTGKELVFDSVKDCASFLSSLENNVSRALNKGWVHKGYKLEKIGRQSMSEPIIGKCRITGEVRYKFDSINACSKYFTGARGCGVRKSLKNPGVNTYKGCYWYYSE